MTDEQRGRLVAEARALVGTPFQHAGRGEHGLDCVGLLVLSARRAGMAVYDNTSYSSVVNGEFMRSELDKVADRCDDGEPMRPGDILTFSMGRHPQHMALITDFYYGMPMIVHSYQTVGRVVEHVLDETWSRRMLCRYQWRCT